MGVFNDLLENTKAVFIKVCEKSSDTYDVAKLNSIKAKIERDINKQYRVLGEKYYGCFKEEKLGSVDFSKEIETLDDLIEQRSDILNRIAQLKNLKRCSVCGSPQNADNSHCSECGTKL